MNVPADLLYSTDHEWVRELGGGRIRIGITGKVVGDLHVAATQ